jgi:hypothetical protein
MQRNDMTNTASPSPITRRRRTGRIAAALAGALATGLLAGTVASPASATGPAVANGDIVLTTFGGLLDGGSGIDKLANITLTRSRVASFGPGYEADRISTEADGDLIMGNDAGQVRRIDHLTGSSTIIHDHVDGTSVRAFTDLAVRADGSIVVIVRLTTGTRLGVMNPTTGAITFISSSNILQSATGLAVDYQGNYVVTAGQGLFRFNPTTGAVSQVASFDAWADGLVIDRQGRILVHVRAGGLFGPRIVAVAPLTNAVSTASEGGELRNDNYGMAMEADGRVVSVEIDDSSGTSTVVRVDPNSGLQKALITVGVDEARDVSVAGVSQIGGFTRPIALDDTFDMDAAVGQVTGQVLTNDHDPLGQRLHYATLTAPGHGFISAFASGDFFYFPNPGFVGQDFWTYKAITEDGRESSPTTVRVNVGPPSTPTAHDDAFTVTQSGSPGVPTPGVLANDTDPQGSSLTAAQLSGPSQGSATLFADGSVAVTPPADFVGTMQLTYVAVDPEGHHSAPATVLITVTPSDPTVPRDPDPADPGAPATNTAPRVRITPTSSGLAAGTNGRSGTFPLTVLDKETPGSLKLTVSTSNSKLVPAKAIKLTTSAAGTRAVTITAAKAGRGRAVVTIKANDGTLSASVQITVLAGNARANRISGTPGADLLIGRGGRDRLLGLAGRDVLTGGGGKDKLTGGTGSDFFRGGAGKDRITDFFAKLGDLRIQI